MPSTSTGGLPIPLDTDPVADLALAVRNLANAFNTAWTAVTFQNSWVNFGAPQQTVEYRKVGGNRVQIRGLMKFGTVGSPAFTLPAGFRPPADLIFPVVANNAFGRLDVIASSGVVQLVTGTNQFVDVNIEFSV